MILSHVVFTHIFLLGMVGIGKWIPNKEDAMEKSIPSLGIDSIPDLEESFLIVKPTSTSWCNLKDISSIYI